MLGSGLLGALGCVPGKFRSCRCCHSCFLLCLRILARQITTFAIVSLSVPASLPTQFVGFNSEKVVSALKRSLVSLPDFSTARRDFILRLNCILCNFVCYCLDSLTRHSGTEGNSVLNACYLRPAGRRFKSPAPLYFRSTKKVCPNVGTLNFFS